jgi:uncharacterized protein (TIGR00369 family)
MPAPDWSRLVAAYNLINQYGQANGMVLTVPAPGQAEYRMAIREDHLSSPGTAHGGVVAGLMDSALGAAALTLAFTTAEFVSTVEFKLNYLYPVRLHDQLVARARVEHTGNKLIVSSCTVFRIDTDGKETAVAQGLGTFNRYPADKRDFGNLLMQ